MTKPLTIACAKGYLWKKALAYLTNMGITFDNDLSELFAEKFIEFKYGIYCDFVINM